MEIPITIRYSGLKNTSKKMSIFHGADVVSTIFRVAVESRPLIFFGLTGLIILVAGIITALDVVALFNDSRYFSLPLATLTLGLMMIGSLLILASLIFYALKRFREAK